jgi:hypothetical protein
MIRSYAALFGVMQHDSELCRMIRSYAALFGVMLRYSELCCVIRSYLIVFRVWRAAALSKRFVQVLAASQRNY